MSEIQESEINKIWRSGKGFINGKWPDKRAQEAGRKGGLARAKFAKKKVVKKK